LRGENLGKSTPRNTKAYTEKAEERKRRIIREMSQNKNASLHDAYAADYDSQVKAYACYITDVLFGLCYEYLQPGEKLLDAGIGSGLSSLPFAKAGQEIHGMDFSPAMLEICRAKNFTASLKQHDLQKAPWPYPNGSFDGLVCCGVFHFIPKLESIFGEARRVLRAGRIFAFTTKVAPDQGARRVDVFQETTGGFEIYSHAPGYIEARLEKEGYIRLKMQNCFIGEEVFTCWVVNKEAG
jgi:predicted TPR repeat methyltransferase